MSVFEHIFVPLDGSQLAECVLPHLPALADAETRITLARVLETQEVSSPEQPVSPLDWQIMRAEVNSYLERIAADLHSEGIHSVEQVILEGSAAEAVIEFAQKNGVDLILLSSHGKSGVSRWNVSSVVRKIVDRSLLSTMIIRAYNCISTNLTGQQYQHILVPLDGSLRSEISLSAAVSLVQRHNAQLTLAHVLTRPELIQRLPQTSEDQELFDRFTNRAKEIAERYFDQLRSQLPVPFKRVMEFSSDVTNTLERIAHEHQVDLIVMSAHGHSADSMRTFGNVTGGLIEYGTTSLITIQDLQIDEITPQRVEEEAREVKGHI